MINHIRIWTISTIASAAIANALYPVAVHAETKSDQVVTASKAGAANPNLQLSQDGFSTMRDVRAARVAIFNGDTAAATKFIEQAKMDIGKASSDEKMIVAKDGEPAMKLVPIDGQIVVSDNFVATPEKAKNIATGNEKLKEGKTKEAIEALKLADVDIGFSRVLMPLGTTTKHLDTAADLLNEGKFYEANMALKAVEDGLVLDTVVLVEAPKK